MGGATPLVLDPSAAGRLTLTQLLGYAAAHAPTLGVARQQAALGDAEVEGAETLNRYNPQLAVSAGGRTVDGVTRFEFGAQIAQQFEIGGERGTRIEAAARGRDARLAQLEVARWRLYTQVHTLHYQLLVREKQLVAADKIAVFTSAVADIINKRVAAGADAPLKTIVANAELAKARQLVIAAKQAQRATVLRLVEVLGWPAAVPLKVVGALPPPASINNAASLLEMALERHPAKRWLHSEVRAAEARVEREERQVWPDPTLAFSYGREAEAGAAAHVWMGTLSVPLPIWQQNQLGRARAHAQMNVVRARQSAFETALGARIAAAVARVNAAAASIDVYGKDILPALEGNLKKLRRAFELGEIDVLQLAQIQQRILVTQQDNLQALDDYYVALAALEALSGVDVLAERDPTP